MYKNSPDTQLLDYWRSRRDADAFAELVTRYGPLVYSACLRVLRSTHAAEDAAQDCFVDLIHANIRARSLPAFLHTAATRRAVDRLRSEKRRRDREARFAAEQPVTADPIWEEVSHFVDEAIASLPEKQRQLVALRFLQGRTYAEIAEETSLPPSTVQHHLNKGIDAIRRRLKRHGIVASAGALTSMLAAAPSHALPSAVATRLGTMALAGGFAAPTASLTSVAASTSGALFGKTTIMASAALIAGLLFAVPLVLLPPETTREPDSAAEIALTDAPTTQTVFELDGDSPEAAIAAADSPNAVPNDTLLEGIVVTRLGRPTAGAVVTATWPGGPRTAESDADGRFSIPLPVDEASERIDVMLSAAMGGYAVFPTPYSIPRGGLRGIELILEPASAISGKVIDREGRPLPGWRVVADRGDFLANTLTGENGTFHISSLRPGDYSIHAQSKDQRQTWYNGGMPYTLVGGLTDTTLTLIWPPSDISLAGSVTDSMGEPIEGVELRSAFSLSETGEQQLLRTKTDAEGRFVLAGFPDRPDFEANLQVAHRDYMQDQRYGIALDGHEEHFVLPKRPVVRGRVIDLATGDPITRFRIDHAVGASAGAGSSDLELMELAGRAPLEEHNDGEFSLQARGFNTLRLVVASPGFATQLTVLNGVAPGSVLDDLEIRLQKSSPLKGAVMTENGTPVSGARIYLGHAILPNGPFTVRGAEGVTRTDSAGSFSLDEYPPDLAVVSVYHEAYAVNWTTPKAGQPLNIVLHEGRQVEGTVYWGDEPMGAGRASIGLGFEDGPSVTSAFTDERGRYQLTGVPPGTVWISAGYHEGGLRRSLVRRVETRGTANEVQDFHFDAGADAYIGGVLLLDGDPVPLALIHAKSKMENGDSITFGVESRGDGTYTLGPVSAGEYEFGPMWILLRDGSYLAPEPEIVRVPAGETTAHDLLFSSQ